jgi:hypothetical protein
MNDNSADSGVVNALGIDDPLELARIAQEVPDAVRYGCHGCQNCLWSCVECKGGSMYDAQPNNGCGSWMYYD